MHGRAGARQLRFVRKRQVVGGDDADGRKRQQMAEDDADGHLALGRVRALQHFVQQVEHALGVRARRSRRVDDQPQALQACHEVRHALLEGILDADARVEDERRHPHLAGADRTAGVRQDEVDADRLEQRALARHVRAGDEQSRARRPDLDVVGHADVRLGGTGGRDRGH